MFILQHVYIQTTEIAFCLTLCFAEEVWRARESKRVINLCWRTPCCASQDSIRRAALTSMSPVRCSLKANLWPCLYEPPTRPSALAGSEYIHYSSRISHVPVCIFMTYLFFFIFTLYHPHKYIALFFIASFIKLISSGHSFVQSSHISGSAL